MASAKGFTPLTHEDRIKMEALLNEKHTVQEIAAHLGKSLSTIYNERKREQYTRITTELIYVKAYSADVAQQDYDYKATAKGADLKIANDYKLVEHIEQKIIHENYSPAAVLGQIKDKGLKFQTSICFKTLYNYIDKNIFMYLTNKNLPRKKNKINTYKKVHIRAKRPLCRSIEDRPQEIRDRITSGHWEMDTVVGKAKGKGAALLVLTERVTRDELIFKIPSKTTSEVVKILNRLERKHGAQFKHFFKTFTVDNGSEFMDTDGMEHSCRTKGDRTIFYYCHPYSSWERGSNENANSLIRRFIPKGTPIENYTDAEIKQIEYWINHYPRKIFGYRCAADLYEEQFKTA